MIQKMQQYDQLNIEDEKVFEIAQSCIYQDALAQVIDIPLRPYHLNSGSYETLIMKP